MPDLGAYLTAVGGKPWIWGKADCCTFPADWLILCGLPDPMAKWRGAYDDEWSCAALIEDAGGLLSLWIEALGQPENLEPEMGNVGVVQMWGHCAGAIFTGKRWAVRTTRGWAAASFAPADVLGAWRHG
ncbi:MAG: hypothetical protein VYC29_09410 [Pseudomonadota bacterium]|nr:hypothetical protein [Pseudomonadota bacterium]|tara:strand:+ start:13377 stop:13763 length:387 start_codon:yes stop_codon:yes gene_type:complete